LSRVIDFFSLFFITIIEFMMGDGEDNAEAFNARRECLHDIKQAYTCIQYTRNRVFLSVVEH